MGRWELSSDVFLAGSTRRVFGVAHHPGIHAAASSSNNGVVVVMSVVLFGALVLLAVQINPFRARSASSRKSSSRQPAND